MRSIVIGLLLLSKIGDTPEQTFEELRKAVTEKNWKAFYELLAPSDRKQMESEWDKNKKDLAAAPPEDLAEMVKMVGVKIEELKTLSAKEVMIRIMGHMAETGDENFRKEVGMFKDAKLQEKKVNGDDAVLKIKNADGEKEIELVREERKWYFSPMSEANRLANERNASVSLKTLATAQADFRANDRDGDKIANFWVKDVAGLYGLEAPPGSPIKLIEESMARADKSTGRGSYPSLEGTEPKAKYYFAALKKYGDGGKSIPYDDGTGRNRGRFGAAAFPATYGRTTGKQTFIINEGNTMFSKDTGGKPPEEFPEDPVKEGWKKLD